MKTKPDLGFWKLWNLSFGFFGVQIAYALQSANVSRIFSTIGADPHDLSYFWILPPLMGLLVQPIVGSLSDKTWNRFGRRLPYLIIGALIAVIVMCFLPNSGSLGLSVSSAIIFGLIMLMFLDTSINMAMQPFKMLVGDMVNEKQKGLAYSIQSFLCNAGSVVGFVAPFVLAYFLANTAPAGEVPPTVTWSFYIGAAILILCVIYTFWKVKEMPPKQYAEYHGISEKPKEKSENMFKLLIKAPKVFWTVGLVQFFCWAAFLYMWTYSADAVAGHAFNAPSVEKVEGINVNGIDYNDKYLFNGDQLLIKEGHLMIAGIEVDGKTINANLVAVNNDTIISNSQIAYSLGNAKVKPGETFAKSGDHLIVDGNEIIVSDNAKTVTTISIVPDNATLTLAHIAAKENGADKYTLEQTEDITISQAKDIKINTSTVLNAASKEYQEAGDWNGILYAIQAMASVLWALVLPRFRNRKFAYSLSLLIGGIGFASIFVINNPWMLAISYVMIGTAWAAMLAMPFTILTNALSGNHIGTYLGLFNGTICLPQIIAALIGGSILSLFPLAESGAAETTYMMIVAGIFLAIAAICVWGIKETYGSQEKA